MTPYFKNCAVCLCHFPEQIVAETDKKLCLQRKFKTSPQKRVDHICDFIYAERQTNYCLKNYENRLKTSVLRRFLVRVTGFEPAASCSQSRRATNCATPGYEVVGWPGRILPKQARYQLRYTRIFNLLHDSTRGKKNQAITAIKCSNIFDDFFLYLEYNTATTSKALEEFSLEKAERRH